MDTKQSRGVVVCFWLGGTIASTHQNDLGGALATLSGEELLQSIDRPDWPIDVEVVELARLPSTHFTPTQVFGWREPIRRALERANVVGGVVVQGTNTLEECAYLHDLVLDSDKPLVYTGAMRLADDDAPDGPRNIEAALAVAAAPSAQALGVLVVMNDEIHAARDVQKLHTSGISAFTSPNAGPLGVVVRERSELDVRIARRPAIREHVDTSRIEERVGYVKAVLGAGSECIDAALNYGVRGVVIEAFGIGDAALDMRDGLERAFARNVAVVVASRAPAGSVSPRYADVAESGWLWERGARFAGDLSGPKARIRLMLVLGLCDESRVDEYFRSKYSRMPETGTEQQSHTRHSEEIG